jgi:PAS domain S-box-containing protein
MAEDEREPRLRKKAENLVGADLASREDLTPDQMRHLVHELRVHQIELQMQNEELRSAQDQLEKARTKYFELYDLAPVAYLTLDGDGVILEANLRAADLVGHAGSGLLRQKLRDFVNFSQLDAFAEHLRAVAKTDGRRTCELELVRRDRSTVAVHLETVRISVEGKEGAWELRTSITDITEHKRAEARVLEGERFARKINESSLNGLYIYNIEREEIVYINRECERLTGYTPGDLPTMRGEAFFSLFLPEDRSRVTEYIAQVSQAGDGETREIECRFKTADGRWIWCLSRNAVFERDKEGKARAIIGTFLDVTARKQAEEALGQAHERAVWLARFPDENPNPVVRVSADGHVLYRNPAAAELPGWACEVGKPLPELLLPIIGRAMAQGREAQQDVQLGGKFYSVWVASFPRESYANVYGRDITDRKRVEEKLQKASDELAHRVLERTAELRAALLYARSLIEASLDPLVTISPEGKITDVNAATETVTGRTRKELIGSDFSDYFTEREEARAGYEQVFREGSVRDYPLELRHRDGHITPVLYNASVYHDEKGQIVGVFAAARDVTERKRAEEAVKTERQRLYDVMETLPAYVILLTPDYHVPFANRFFRERFGESHGKRCFEYLFGRTEPCKICETYKVLNTNAPHHWEWTGPDGRNYDIFDFPFTDTDGSPLIMEMGIDITELKRTEKSLKEANEALERRVAERTAELAAARDAAMSERKRLEAVMEVLPVGVAVIDARGGNIRSNDMFNKVWGSPRPAAREVSDYQAYKAWWVDTGKLVQPEDWASARAVQKGETVIGQMIEIESFDGVRKFVMNSAAPVQDAAGNVVGSAVTIQDISDIKRFEQALQHSLRRFELLAETAGELLQTPEPQKIVDSLCRRVMERLDCHAFFNFLVDEQAGRLHLNACAGIPPEEARRIEWLDYGVAVCGCVARDGFRIVAEHIPTTPDVRTELVKSYGIKAYACHPLLGAGGRLIGTLSFGTRSRETFSPDDLSLMKAVADQVAVAMIRMQGEQALRASEEALRKANEQLEEKVRERTAELLALNENLMESRDQLRSLASDLVLTEAREKRALASELHDTVAQMLAIAKLTLESTGARLEGKSREEVKRVVQLLQEASRQTRSLMADLSPSLLYEAGLGQALHALARRMGELHSLAIEVVDDGSPKPLGEDYRVLLFRAVQELLHNTVKHAKATKVKISLQRDGTHVRIEVEDDGVGFLLSERRRGDGMREGFGLFSIQERLRHCGGSFEVFSQPGRGVRAVLVVPLQVEGEGEGREPAVVRILIAEDHRMMRDALASLLEKEPGFEVVGLAEDGLEAVHLARKVKPDVVLMDVNMPRMDGIEATRRITAELPEIKVIGLSVHAEPQIASEMLAAGATSFVAKSSSPEELIEAIRTAVGSRKGN